MTANEKPRAEVLRVMLERDEDGCNHIVVVAGWVCMYEKAGVRAFLWDAADELLAFIEEEFGPHPDEDDNVVRMIADNPDGGVSKLEDMAASAATERDKPDDGKADD